MLVPQTLALLITATPAQAPMYVAHRTCTQRHDDAACERALALYPAYLAVHGDDWDARFFFAELLWTQERFVEAAAQYHVVARSSSGRYARLAAYDEILALKRAVKPTPHRHDGQPWPLSVEQHLLLEAIDFHLARWPGVLTDELNLAAWALHVEADDFEAAARRLAAVRDRTTSQPLLEELAQRRDARRDPLGVTEPIGAPQTIGESQPIGEGQTIGSPQTIGGPPEEEEEVLLESCTIRFGKEEGPGTEAPSPSELIIY